MHDIFNKIQNELEGLPRNANGEYTYNGHQIDKQRHEVLMCNETKDIQAYPGTGKTNLLVDKLSLLLKYWDLKNSGILVLSHANVAKDEIIKLSKKYPELEKLLHYPHYIGTIHNFANTFLGLPYIRSNITLKKDITITIDDDLSASKVDKMLYKLRWNFCLRFGEQAILDKLTLEEKLGIENRKGEDKQSYISELTKKYDKDCELRYRYAKDNGYCDLRYVNLAFVECMIHQKLNLNDKNKSNYKLFSEQKEQLTEEGYFYHNDLLYFSLKLIEKNSFVIFTIQKRFPIVFIDEAQDNSKLQSTLLHKLFIEGQSLSKVQRFGDINQKIYSGEIFEEWKFPSNNLEISKSHRCKNNIAKFASKFIIEGSGFEGNSEGNLCYISFNKENISQVLEKFVNKIKELNLNTRPEFSAIVIGKDGRSEEISKKGEHKIRINSYLPGFNKDLDQDKYESKSFYQGLSLVDSIIKNGGNTSKAYKILDLFRFSKPHNYISLQ